MTESRLFLASAVLCAIIAVACAAAGHWLGAIGSLFGSLNAISARLLLKWKPESPAQ